MAPLALVLLAAGAGRRMRGGDKLLEKVNGVALLRHLAMQALAAGLDPVAVTLRPDAPARRAVLRDLSLSILPVPDADAGMSESLKVAAQWAMREGAGGLMVCPADLPELTARDFASLARAFDPDGPPLRATSEDGAPGHPVIFPARLLPDFAALQGDRGAQPLLARHRPRLIALPDRHATTDLDTPEDWATWRARPRPDGC